MSNKKIAFATLGCKVNAYDTEAMRELFEKSGYETKNFEEFSDIYLINTCAVTNLGDKKSRQLIRRAKRINSKAIVAVTGCYAQTAPDDIEKIGDVNIIIGTKDRHKIVDLVEDYLNKYPDTDKILNLVSDIKKENKFEKLSINDLKDHTRAYLKIQEGCDRFCTYCIIPYARGPIRSRPPEDVVCEVKRLSEKGFKEIILTGIHVASYGLDLKRDITLIDIIKQVHDIKGIERIRFSSIEPVVITNKFISELKNLPKVCDHFHLSLQSGCNKTLKRMGRRYTKEEYKDAVKKIREIYPDAAITTDIIVGFPGESESDYKESEEFSKEIKLSKIHVFPYSPKKGTKAEKYPNQITADIKKKRTQRLIKISNDLNKEFLLKYMGETRLVLFEKKIKNKIYEGHTSNYITVHAESEKDISNNILKVKIDKILKEETVFGFIE